MENLGNDVLENILFRLPLGTASSQDKRVCKSWKTILTNRPNKEVGYHFACRYYKYGCRNNKTNKIKLYFGVEYDHIDSNKMTNYYYSCETLMEMEHCRFAFTSYQDDILVGSCNGLVYLQKDVSTIHKAEPFSICNPLTGEFIILKANLSRVMDGEPKQVSNAFGYCQSTNEYKVVRIVYTFKSNWQLSRVQVYTIGSNEWRDIETCIDHIFFASGIFANGVLHWLNNGFEERKHIAVFDLEDEKFRALPLPPTEVLDRRLVSDVLNFLGGNLCWVQRDSCSTDIWAYKRSNTSNPRCGTEEYDQKRDYYSGNSWNWVKEFSMCQCYHEPFAITKTNQVLLSGGKNIYRYDLKTRTISKLGDDGSVMGSSRIQVIHHANSYVSLKDFGETWYGPGCSAVPQT
ncbi:F-box/kelch-repeat protein At3g06240-like [Papaver somniferum]|uniref:F-box/kelch-repeat protein At3g06240-like n=1 Tax=Papaver somniferum TaxID=3469 RepID=UPI000E6FB7D0|nr:F-box/kelch-repeat protein At3g06240-like [Papaver somniferum]